MKNALLKFPTVLVGILVMITAFSGCEDDDDDKNSPPVPRIDISSVNWVPYEEGMRLEKGDRIVFDGTGSTDPDGDELIARNFKWDFDDKDGIKWALIFAPDNTIHRVIEGNYMGQNHGRVITVTDQTIELTEIVPDGLGNYIERSSAVTLIE